MARPVIVAVIRLKTTILWPTLNPYETPKQDSERAGTGYPTMQQRLAFAVFASVNAVLTAPFAFFASLTLFGVRSNAANVLIVLALTFVVLFVLYRTRLLYLHQRNATRKVAAATYLVGCMVGIACAIFAHETLFTN